MIKPEEVRFLSWEGAGNYCIAPEVFGVMRSVEKVT